MPDEKPAVTVESVFEAIRPVQDPELHLGIVDLGLVYDVVLADSGENVTVKMTLTSPMCPVGPMLLSAVHESVARLPGVNNVNVELVWEPPWDPSVMATEEVKDVLGIW
jgi:metal-sulfur cluster biosynthetic enzyme